MAEQLTGLQVGMNVIGVRLVNVVSNLPWDLCCIMESSGYDQDTVDSLRLCHPVVPPQTLMILNFLFVTAVSMDILDPT